MKKGILLIICLMLLASAVLPVMAAGSAYMGLSASAPTVYRGDTFTVSVNLTNDQAVGRGAIVLNYDTSVFEFVGGSCNVSGATLAEVSAGRKGGVFALAENRVVSGTIFTIQMQVKPGAAFGSYTISGTPSMDVPCGAGSVVITVDCNHSFGAFQNVDATQHQRVCSVCNQVEKSGHTWDSGTVKVAATCQSTGVKSYRCTGCGLTREETVPVSNEHKYADWVKVDDNSHKGTCSVCGKSGSFGHTWEVAEVLKDATCTVAGSQNMACAFCTAEKTETVPMTEHTYSAFTSVDDRNHVHSCTGCGKKETLPHGYSEGYGYDVNEHYRVCDGCGHTKDPAAHVPGPEATEDTPQLCTVCGRILKPAKNHVHNFAGILSMDQNGHWYGCDGCDEQNGLKFHVFDSDCDDSCDVCGYVRIPPHSFSPELTADEKGHWYPCTGCGEKKAYTAHTPGEEASIKAAQVCTVCGYEMVSRVEHDHSFDTVLHYHECVCGDRTEASEEGSCPVCGEDAGVGLGRFPWWILCVLEAVIIAALILLPILRKKKQEEPMQVTEDPEPESEQAAEDEQEQRTEPEQQTEPEQPQEPTEEL